MRMASGEAYVGADALFQRFARGAHAAHRAREACRKAPEHLLHHRRAQALQAVEMPVRRGVRHPAGLRQRTPRGQLAALLERAQRRRDQRGAQISMVVAMPHAAS